MSSAALIFRPGSRRGVGDQADDRLHAEQRAASPVLGDEREDPVLDLVPLARAGWVVGHGEEQPGIPRKILQFDLPKPCAVAAAAAGIGGNKDRRGDPCATTTIVGWIRRQFRGVVIDAEVYSAFVARDVVDAVWNCISEVSINEVVTAHGLWLARRLPILPLHVEIADHLFFLRVDRNHGLILA